MKSTKKQSNTLDLINLLKFLRDELPGMIRRYERILVRTRR